MRLLRRGNRFPLDGRSTDSEQNSGVADRSPFDRSWCLSTSRGRRAMRSRSRCGSPTSGARPWFSFTRRVATATTSSSTTRGCHGVGDVVGEAHGHLSRFAETVVPGSSERIAIDALRADDAVRAVADACERHCPTLVVLGTHARDRRRWSRSRAERIVRAISCPVMMVRAPARAACRRGLLVDASVPASRSGAAPGRPRTARARVFALGMHVVSVRVQFDGTRLRRRQRLLHCCSLRVQVAAHVCADVRQLGEACTGRLARSIGEGPSVGAAVVAPSAAVRRPSSMARSSRLPRRRPGCSRSKRRCARAVRLRRPGSNRSKSSAHAAASATRPAAASASVRARDGASKPPPDANPRRRHDQRGAGRRRTLLEREDEQGRAGGDADDSDREPHVRDRLLGPSRRDLVGLGRRARTGFRMRSADRRRSSEPARRRARRSRSPRLRRRRDVRPGPERDPMRMALDRGGSAVATGAAPSVAPDCASMVSAVLAPAVSVTVRVTSAWPA